MKFLPRRTSVERWISQGNFRKAHSFLERLRDPETLFLRGLTYKEQGYFSRAKDCFAQTERLWETNSDATSSALEAKYQSILMSFMISGKVPEHFSVLPHALTPSQSPISTACGLEIFARITAMQYARGEIPAVELLRARALASQACELYQQIGDMEKQLQIQLFLAKSYMQRPYVNRMASLSLLRSLIRQDDTIKFAGIVAQSYLEIARLEVESQIEQRTKARTILQMAEKSFRAAVQVFQEGNHMLGQAHVEFCRDEIYRRFNHFDEGRIDRIKTIYEEKDYLIGLELLYRQIGQWYQNHGELQCSQEWEKRLEEIQHRMGSRMLKANKIYFEAQQRWIANRPREALELLDQKEDTLLTFYERFLTYHLQLSIYQTLHDEKAIDLAEKKLKTLLREHEVTPLHSPAYLQLGNTIRGQQALAIWAQGCAIDLYLSDWISLANKLSHMALHRIQEAKRNNGLSKEDLRQTESEFSRALQLLEGRPDFAAKKELVGIWKNHAIAYALQGHVKFASKAYEKAQNLSRQLRLPVDLGYCQIQEGLMLLDQLQKASHLDHQYFDRARTLFSKAGEFFADKSMYQEAGQAYEMIFHVEKQGQRLGRSGISAGQDILERVQEALQKFRKYIRLRQDGLMEIENQTSNIHLQHFRHDITMRSKKIILSCLQIFKASEIAFFELEASKSEIIRLELAFSNIPPPATNSQECQNYLLEERKLLEQSVVTYGELAVRLSALKQIWRRLEKWPETHDYLQLRTANVLGCNGVRKRLRLG